MLDHQYLKWFVVVGLVYEEVDDRLHGVTGSVKDFEGIARRELNDL